jgi:hypothetical protein
VPAEGNEQDRIMKIVIAIAFVLMLSGCASFIEKNACLFPGDETGYSRPCNPKP